MEDSVLRYNKCLIGIHGEVVGEKIRQAFYLFFLKTQFLISSVFSILFFSVYFIYFQSDFC